MPLSSDFVGLRTSYHWVGLVVLLVDFCVTGVPVRLLHFVQPFAFALFYNVVLLIYSSVTQSDGAFYFAADFYSRNPSVSRFRAFFSVQLSSVQFSLFDPTQTVTRQNTHTNKNMNGKGLKGTTIALKLIIIAGVPLTGA